jgi:hypothetical protein
MHAPWLRFVVAVVAVVVVVSLAALEMITARPRVDTVVADMAASGGDWREIPFGASE